MKKNLLGFIGTICAFITIFFLKAPVITFIGEHYYTFYQQNSTIGSILGLTELSSFDMRGVVLLLSLISVLVALIVEIKGIVENKNVIDIVFILSCINAFAVFYFIVYLKNMLATSRYSLGWGIVIVLLLFSAFFVLSLVGFILNAIKSKRDKSEDLTKKDNN